MIADMLSNKEINPIKSELFIRGRKVNISAKYFFSASKNIRLNSTHYFFYEVPNKQEIQQITFNHSSDIAFMKTL